MTVRVAIASDENYAVPLAACVRSVLDNTNDVELAILSCEITAASKAALRSSWPEAAGRINWFDIDQSALNDLPTTSRIQKHLTTATYARLLLPEILPAEWDRVLFLDTDTITLGDLRPLWETPLNGYPFAAVPDPYNPVVSSESGVAGWRDLGLDPNTPYFNAGVMLMDVVKWREEEISKRCMEYVSDHRDEVLTADQEGLNAVSGGRFVALDPLWNVMTYWYLVEHEDSADKAVVDHARIRHFNGDLKPWSGFSRESLERSKGWHLKGTGRRYSPGSARPHLDFGVFFTNLDRTAWRGWRPDSVSPDTESDVLEGQIR